MVGKKGDKRSKDGSSAFTFGPRPIVTSPNATTAIPTTHFDNLSQVARNDAISTRSPPIPAPPPSSPILVMSGDNGQHKNYGPSTPSEDPINYSSTLGDHHHHSTAYGSRSSSVATLIDPFAPPTPTPRLSTDWNEHNLSRIRRDSAPSGTGTGAEANALDTARDMSSLPKVPATRSQEFSLTDPVDLSPLSDDASPNRMASPSLLPLSSSTPIQQHHFLPVTRPMALKPVTPPVISLIPVKDNTSQRDAETGQSAAPSTNYGSGYSYMGNIPSPAPKQASRPFFGVRSYLDDFYDSQGRRNSHKEPHQPGYNDNSRRDQHHSQQPNPVGMATQVGDNFGDNVRDNYGNDANAAGMPFDEDGDESRHLFPKQESHKRSHKTSHHDHHGRRGMERCCSRAWDFLTDPKGWKFCLITGFVVLAIGLALIMYGFFTKQRPILIRPDQLDDSTSSGTILPNLESNLEAYLDAKASQLAPARPEVSQQGPGPPPYNGQDENLGQAYIRDALRKNLLILDKSAMRHNTVLNWLKMVGLLLFFSAAILLTLALLLSAICLTGASSRNGRKKMRGRRRRASKSLSRSRGQSGRKPSAANFRSGGPNSPLTRDGDFGSTSSEYSLSSESGESLSSQLTTLTTGPSGLVGDDGSDRDDAGSQNPERHNIESTFHK